MLTRERALCPGKRTCVSAWVGTRCACVWTWVLVYTHVYEFEEVCGSMGALTTPGVAERERVSYLLPSITTLPKYHSGKRLTRMGSPCVLGFSLTWPRG